MGKYQKKLLVLAKALANPLRLQILLSLLQKHEMDCGELTRRFPVAQPTISHHLNILRSAGIVRMRKSGKHHIFRVDTDALKAFSDGIQRLAPLPHTRGKQMTLPLPKKKSLKKS